MDKSCPKLQQSSYGDIRNIVCFFLEPFPQPPSLFVEKRIATRTLFDISVQKFTRPYQVQRISLRKDESIIKILETPQPFPTISLEDFIKKHLSPEKQKSMWKDFKKDLWQEVIDGKISKIKYYRIVHKLTQKMLAKKLGMEQPNIARLEKVGRTPNILTLKKLGKVFQIDYKELL